MHSRQTLQYIRILHCSVVISVSVCRILMVEFHSTFPEKVERNIVSIKHFVRCKYMCARLNCDLCPACNYCISSFSVMVVLRRFCG